MITQNPSPLDTALQEIAENISELPTPRLQSWMRARITRFQEETWELREPLAIARFCGAVTRIVWSNAHKNVIAIRRQCLELSYYVQEKEWARFLVLLHTAKKCSSQAVFYRSIFETLLRLYRENSPENRQRITYILTYIRETWLDAYFAWLEESAQEWRERERTKMMTPEETVWGGEIETNWDENDTGACWEILTIASQRMIKTASEILEEILNHRELDRRALIGSIGDIERHLTWGEEHQARPSSIRAGWSAYASIRD